MRLERKVALVTGAAKGIGESIARHFAAEGAFVYVTDIDQGNGQQVASSLGQAARFALLDVRDEAAWQKLTKDIIVEHGRLDIVVNNAGITGFEEGFVPHDPENATLDAWRKVHETNLDGVFLGCKYAIKAMRSTGKGSIINLSSRSGIVGIPTAAAYASSKAGVRNHTKSVALYCAQQNLNVRCNSIHPAAILTPMWEPMLGDGPEREANMAAFVQDTPLRRFGLPEEVACVAVMLASDESGYLTGTEINIDGGILAGSAGASASTPPITLRLMTERDLPMLHDWLNRPHIVEWWGGDEERPTLDEVLEHYLPRAMAEESVTPYIAMLGEEPIGYAQSYVALGSGDGWWEDETDPGVRGIDQSLADPTQLNKGLGTRLVRALVELLFSDPTVTKIQTDPTPNNHRAIRCYEKAGFVREKIITTPDGPAVYMVQTRQAFERKRGVA